MKKILSIVLSIMLMAMLVLSSGIVFAENKPELYIQSVETPVLTTGETSLFKFKLGQHGVGAQNIKIRAELDAELKNAVQFDTSTGTVQLDYFTENPITTWLKINPALKDGVYKLNLSFTYEYIVTSVVAQSSSGEDSDKKESSTKTESILTKADCTDSCTIYIQTKNDNMPFVQSAKFNKKEIGIDNKALLSVFLVNPTYNEYKDVRISLDMESTKDFTLYENFKPIVFDDIKGKETKEAIFSVYVASSVVSGNYPLIFNVSYRNSDNTITTIKEQIFIEVKRSPEAEGGADGKGSKPRIIVSKYAVDVDEIKAGKTFTLDFTLQNTSSSASVSNIKVVVDSAESAGSPNSGSSSGAVFFPAQGSNSFFIESIGPKKTASNQIKLMAKQDIEPGVYPVKIRLEYDSNGVAQTPTEENISFPVSQEQRLDMTGFTPPLDGFIGQPIPINFQYINKGKATIYNFSVHVEGEFTLDGGDVYVGNLTAGYNDFFESSIIPNAEGEQKGAIVLKYEDSQGNPKEQRTEFTVNVMPMDPNIGGIPGTDVGGNFDPITGMPIEQPKKGPSVLVIIVGVVFLLAGAGAGAFFIIRKKRKAKKEMMLDEEI